MCKLDMEKAYNHVSLDFVDYVLERLRFEWKWRRWICLCVYPLLLQ